jgi:putative nucleotidyltransferase with HDIG domain
MYVNKNGRRATAASQVKDALLATISARHADLSEHLSDVAIIAQRVAEALGVSPEELQNVRYAAELHDIGKVAIPEGIVNKPGPLDDKEWEYMRRHTIIGERILAAAPSLARVGQIVRATHEHYDGNGYPDRLRDEEIPLAARIIAACDAYDAMTSPRPYRTVASHAAAIAELRRCAGGQFDPLVVDAFVRVVCPRPTARPKPERLSSGETVGS